MKLGGFAEYLKALEMYFLLAIIYIEGFETIPKVGSENYVWFKNYHFTLMELV